MRTSTSRLVALFLSVMMMITMIAPASANENVVFKSDYASKAEALQAGLDLNERIAEEGMILLKNENAALPLAKGAKVTMLGYAGYFPNAGASANGGDASAGSAIAQATVVSSMNDAGFALNPEQGEVYANAAAAGAASDMDMKAVYASVYPYWEKNYAEYGDAAIVVLRSGKVGSGITHAMQFDAEQLAMIDYAAEHFEKVIVLINNVSIMEMKALQDNEKVDAILSIGEGGDNGFAAVGPVLCGDVTPSGRTVDTWAVDFTKNPSYVNFNVNTADDAHSVDAAGNKVGYTQFIVDGQPVNTWQVGYEEGIYIGYRYYETRAYEEAKAGNEGWWAENVVYPFGYGLSYTDFSWEVTPVTAAESTITKADTLVFDVKVTNNGTAAGKDVVQLYYTAPYGVEATGNETVIEKAHVVLGDFAKTDVLQPGESQTVQVAIEVKDMASYDNVTDKTYVLDAGTYGIKIAQNAHFGSANDVEITYTVAEKALCNESVGGAEITNVLDDVTEGFAKEGYTLLSRADFEGTMPDPYVEYKEITAEEYASFAYDDAAFNAYYDAEAIGEVKVADAADRTSDTYTFTLFDMVGAPADDPRYDELVDQLTLDEMIDLVNYGGFNSRAVPYIGKPFSRDTDGPKGWTGNYVDTNDRFNYFASEPMIASTFNKELLYEMGKVIGDQGIWGNSTIESGMVFSYTGWYGPGMNLHRSPFDSRATEYYSEDPVLTGVLAANLSKGALEKGCYVTLKHFAFHNDGGGAATYRMGPIGSGNPSDGLAAWMTEQTAREIYLKGYQIGVEDGGANFLMGSFTRIGKTWCGGSYAINQQITRDEWGFDGAIVTDITLYKANNAYQLIKSGGDMMLDAAVYGMVFSDFLDKDAILAMDDDARNITLYCLKNTAKHILYMVANSNAMEIPQGAKVIYTGTKEVDDEEVAIKLANAKAGEAYTSEALDGAKLNTYYAYSPITYTATGMPEGLAFEGGVITGTPAAAGTYTIVVTAQAEGYAPASVEYPLVVE